MKKMPLLFLALMVAALAFGTAYAADVPPAPKNACPAPVWTGGHCLYRDSQEAPSIILSFSPKAFAVPGEAETYVVAQNTALTVKNINTFAVRCVNGKSGDGIMPVRAMLVKPDGKRQEISGNYGSGVYLSCYDGGSLLLGNSKEFRAKMFSVQGTYTIDFEYTKYMSSNNPCWTLLKRITVIVAPGKVEAQPVGNAIVGIKKNAYESETTVTKDIYWLIKNTGGLDVNIIGVAAVECGDNTTISGCSFPDFTPSRPITIKAGTDSGYLLKERFVSNRPSKSPFRGELSIDVRFSDIYGLSISNITSRQSPVVQKVEFRPVAVALTPYRKSGEFIGHGDGSRYYIQTCTDSGPDPALDGPILFGMTVYRDKDHTIPIAGTNFHEVPTCTGADDLRFNNTGEGPAPAGSPPEQSQLHGSGLASFVTDFHGDSTLYWMAEGVVGTSTYKTDFARIGLSFDEVTQLAGDLVVDSRMGKQSMQESGVFVSGTHTIAGLKTATADAFSGPVLAGEFSADKLPESSGNPVYMLRDITFNKGTGKEAKVTGPVSSATDSTAGSTGSNELTIGNDGKAYFSTSEVGDTVAPPPKRDVNVVWADKEKYLVEVKAADSGVCRTLQGDTISGNGKAALTGPETALHIKYDWRPSIITDSFCDASNTDYVVCDSAQFATELVKKLDAMDRLIGQGKQDQALQLQNFSAYLMKDGFTPDFMDDFSAYLQSGFFNDLTAFRDEGWPKYFASQGRLKFEPETITEPGIYSVQINIVYDNANSQRLFDLATEPTASVTVKFIKDSPLTKKARENLVYYLPLDGTVGIETMDSLTGLHREGYGTVFSGDRIAISGSGSETVWSLAALAARPSNPVAIADIKVEQDFAAVNSKSPRILQIDRKSGAQNEYSVVFSPSIPLPLAIEAQGKPGEGIAAAYMVYPQSDASGSSIDAAKMLPKLARLTETGYAKGGTIACTDETAAASGVPPINLPAPAVNGTPARTPSPIIGWDKQFLAFRSESPCQIVQSAANSAALVYYFKRPNSDEGRILLESVLYYPAGTGTIGFGPVILKNACTSQGKLYVQSPSSPSGYAGLEGDSTISLSNADKKSISLAEAMSGIAPGNICITSSASLGIPKVPQSVSLWWNEEKIASSFRESLPAELNAKACFGG
ncbi:Uncharacterised protein [uncultured archaeon]|nr:Uncharacterised protein [uncultured archaeon]